MRISKYTVSFVSLFALLIGSFSYVFYKYYPFLFRDLIYHCQHLTCSVIVRWSSNLGVFVFKLMVLLIVLTLIRLLVNYLKIFLLRRSSFKKKVRSLAYESLYRQLQLEEKVVLVKDPKPFAFCLGFLRPKIILSTALLKLAKPQELEAILHHEKYHLEHKDALLMLLAKIIQSLFPFFPLISDQIRHYAVTREVKADEQAIKNLGSRKPLISILKKLVGYDLSPAYSTLPAFTNIDTLEIRIRTLIHDRYHYRHLSRRNLVLSFLSVLILVGLTLAPLHVVNTSVEGKEEVVACINTESCVQTCQQNAGSDTDFTSLHPKAAFEFLNLER